MSLREIAYEHERIMALTLPDSDEATA